MLIIFTLLFLSLFNPIESAVSHSCIPEFPLKQGWLGADAAYSIPLPNNRVAWIFGDTLYGTHRIVKNQYPQMTHNSIGISTCNNGKWEINYTIPKGPQGESLSFFSPTDPTKWYWALDGVYHNKELWVTLLCLTEDSNFFGFRTCGSDLARVSNIDADPKDWVVKYYPLVADGVNAYPSAATAIEGDYLYLFALHEEGSRPVILTRIALAGLENPKENLEYFTRDKVWRHGLVPEDAFPVLKGGTSEISVKYHPERKEWVAVHITSDFWAPGEILIRTAPSVEGPWTGGVKVHQIEDVQRSYKHFDQDTYCYAAKEHPEFAVDGALVLTYVCNTYKPEKLAENMDIYFPKSVVLPFPQL